MTFETQSTRYARDLQPTRYARDLHPADPNYAWIHRHSGDQWVFCCTMGPTFVWVPSEGWQCIVNFDAWDQATMSFETALSLLETAETCRAAEAAKRA